MDDAMKKRVIGVAALASLAVIFVPMLVEQSPDYTPPIPGIAAPRPDFDTQHQTHLQPLADDLTRLEKAGNPVIQQLDSQVPLPVPAVSAVPSAPEKPLHSAAPASTKPVVEALALKGHPAAVRRAIETSAEKTRPTPVKIAVEAPARKFHTASSPVPGPPHWPPKTTRIAAAEPPPAHPTVVQPPTPVVAVKKDNPQTMVTPLEKPPQKPKETHSSKGSSQQQTATTWAVQVGSFSTQEKAQGIVDHLRGKGFAAFHESVVINKRTLHRVRIGPDTDKSHSEKVAGEVQQQFALPGRVIPYR